MSDSTSDQPARSLLRHAAPRLALLALGLAAFLIVGERWLTARALARAVARVEALELRVGGPDFKDAPGKDARAWIAEVAAARRSGLDLLPLASVAAIEGLRNNWASRLATSASRQLPPDTEVVAVFAVARALWTAADAELAGGRPRSAAEHLRALAHVIVILQDGTLPEAICATIACRELETRLAPLAAALSSEGGADALAELAAALADVLPVASLTGALRREGACVIAMSEARHAYEPRAHLLALVTGERIRWSLAACEYWADVGEALAEPDVGLRADALARVNAKVEARPRSSYARSVSAVMSDLPDLVRGAARIQASFDAFRARYGAGQ